MTPGTGPAVGPSPWLAFRVRVIDRIVALVAGVVLAPVIGVLAWLVRREGGPPSVIGLPRVGADGRAFAMWKLRTMRPAADDGSAGGAVITANADDRITPIGRRLRRLRLDELPQVVNVVRGEMGLLGPRPETPSLVDPEDPQWAAVLSVRPGITGPTQLVVERWESETLAVGSQEDRYRTEILPVKLAVDRWYVEGASPAIDGAVAWSMVERFLLGRSETLVERLVRRQVPETVAVPRP